MRRTKIVRFTAKVNGSVCSKIAAIGDCHFGANNFNEEMFEDAIEKCLESKIPVIFMGDLLECATRYSVGAGVYEQKKALQDQVEQMVEYLKPLAKAGLIIGMLTGNHCQRAYKEVGIEPTMLMCQLLDVPYLGYTGRVLLSAGKQTYTIFATHGKSNAKKLVTKLNAAANQTTPQVVDVVLYG